MSTYQLVANQIIDLEEPDFSSLQIVDVARQLARIPHWCGQTTFSVAHHSVVCYHTADSFKDFALFHDVAEIITNDIPRPFKQLLSSTLDCADEYNPHNLTNTITIALCEHFGIKPVFGVPISEVDAVVRLAEWEDLLHKPQTALEKAITIQMRDDCSDSIDLLPIAKRHLERFQRYGFEGIVDEFVYLYQNMSVQKP